MISISRSIFVCLILTFLTSANTQTAPVECVFEDVTGLGYSCSVYNVNLTLPRLEISFSGVHVEGRTDANVVGIRFINVFLPYIPNQIFTTFRNLQNLMAENVNLAEIEPTDLKNASRLRRILASNNHLTSIGAGWFVNSPLLNTLILNHNQIRIIHPEAFSGMRVLSNLQLDNNSLTELNDGLFSDQENLLTLTLNDNLIRKITADTFRGLIRLRNLHLRANLLIDEIPSDVFTNLPALQIILLLNNQISTINNLHFASNLNITDIRLNTNNISVIHPEAFDNLPNINHIRLSQNRCVNRNFVNLNASLEEVRPFLQNCFDNYPRRSVVCQFRNFLSYTCLIENLELKPTEVISISGDHSYDFKNSEVFSVVIQTSKISFVPNQFFTDFPNLKLLQAESSGVTDIRTLRNCQSLNYFLAPNNEISSIKMETFADCGNLSVIDLSGNKISTIEPAFVERLSNLNHLYLSRNLCINQDFEVSKETVNGVVESLEVCSVAREVGLFF